jgi:hypothetical protein
MLRFHCTRPETAAAGRFLAFSPMQAEQCAHSPGARIHSLRQKKWIALCRWQSPHSRVGMALNSTPAAG